MRQSSEAFMTKMLEENASTDASVVKDQSERIAKIIDNNMEKALKKFNEQVSKLTPSIKVETPEEDEGKNEEGGKEDAGESNNMGQSDNEGSSSDS